MLANRVLADFTSGRESICTNCSINVGRSLVGLHYFHVTASVDTMQAYGRFVRYCSHMIAAGR